MKKVLLLLFCFIGTFQAFSQQPFIVSFSPTTGTTGTAVRINGANFTNASAVSFGGVSASSFTSGIDTIEYIIATVASGASGSVSVTTPGGTGTKTGFTFTPPAGSPTISSFAPATATQGATVVINGSNLNTVSAVSFGGVPAASFVIVSDTTTRINAVVNSGASGSVSVTNNIGTATQAGFVYSTPAGAPNIFSFSPSSATSGTTVRINGFNFSNVTAVNFGGVPAASFTVGADTIEYVNAVVGAGASGVISLTNPSGTTSKAGFTYISNTPTITSFTPASGVPGASIIIIGSNFFGATSVRFNNTPATFTVDSSSRITAVVPAGASSGVITVTTPGGTGVSSSNFLVNTSAGSIVKVCPGGDGILTSSMTGISYQWQVNTDSGFVNLVNGTNYAGVNSANLQLISIPASFYGNMYRSIVNDTLVSNVITVQISNTWTGTSDSNWENGANWGCSQTVPDANTDVVISGGAVILHSNKTVRSIVVSPGASLTVKSGYELTITNGQ